MTRMELLAAMAAVGCAGSLAALVVAQGTLPVRSERPKASRPSAAAPETTVHHFVVQPAPPAAAAEPFTVTQPAQEPPPRTNEEALFELDQEFSATKENPAVQRRNEGALRGIVQRLNGSAALPIRELACRGESCRATLEFTSAEHARSVLNRLPDDTEWKEHKFGFNALPENAEDSSSQRYVVYFESGNTQ